MHAPENEASIGLLLCRHACAVQAGCTEAPEPQGSPLTALLLAALQGNPACHPAHLYSPAHPRSAPPAAPAPNLAPGSGRGASAGHAACAGAAQLPSPFNTPNLLSLPLPGAYQDAHVPLTGPTQAHLLRLPIEATERAAGCMLTDCHAFDHS